MVYASLNSRPSRRGYALLVVFLFACAYGSATTLAPAVTLLVDNRSMDPVAIYLGGNAARIGIADPMRKTCVRLPRRWLAGEILIVRPLAGQRWELPPVNLEDAPGWTLDWANTPSIDRISLRPAPRC